MSSGLNLRVLCGNSLQRDVAVLLRRVPVALVVQISQRRDQFGTRVSRVDHLVEESAAKIAGRHVHAATAAKTRMFIWLISPRVQ